MFLSVLPSSGKLTVVHTVEVKLHQATYITIVLDGDIVRYGLCEDLGFADEDRTDKICCICELSKLFIETRIIILFWFISLFREDRALVRSLKELDTNLVLEAPKASLEF